MHLGSICEMTSLMAALAAETSAVTVALTVAAAVTILIEVWACEAETMAVWRPWRWRNGVVAVAMEVGMGGGWCSGDGGGWW